MMDLTEEMIIYQRGLAKKDGVYPPPSLDAVQAVSGFPKRLGPFYIQRRATIASGTKAHIRYDAQKRSLILDEQVINTPHHPSLRFHCLETKEEVL